jgi:hypothetical protein
MTTSRQLQQPQPMLAIKYDFLHNSKQESWGTMNPVKTNSQLLELYDPEGD